MSVKNIFDKSFAILGLIILLPLFVIIAILIKVKMPDGPVIFRQERIGQYAHLFTIYKFRSMHMVHNGPLVSIAGERRITKLGAFLRKYKLDELPELWNVLKGDMSFVGPRPHVPGYMDTLTGTDRIILDLKPGITGPASLKYAHEEEFLSNLEDPLKYHNEVIFPDKVRINLEYYHNHSLLSDIKLIFKTLAVWL